MEYASSGLPHDGAVLRSPERKYLAVLFAGAGFSGPWTLASGGLAEPGIVALVAVVSVALFVLAWRAWRVRTVLAADALEDVTLLRRRTVSRTEIVGVSARRASGVGDGYCLRLDLRDGRQVDVRSSRVYSVVPSGAHLNRLDAFAETVREWTAPARPGR